ncbi:hypothetical protein DFQ28_005081 [Apophysomyces sp. BC1034]|nr:hypothetical protein DFQ28_005081 [Apophysomyces sp. BC1034]
MNLTLEALPHWLQWNEERVSMGLEPVFHQDGVLVLSSHGRFSDFDSNSMQCIREAGYGHVIEELRTPSSITERYPHLEHAVSKGYNIGYLNKQGDGNFLVDYHPEYQNLIIASGDSGHGMKFIPNLGLKICQVLEGVESDYTRAWKWRTLRAEDTRLDGLRANTKIERIILAEMGNEETHMALPKEFLVTRSLL